MKRHTGITQFSAFNGWQIANNAIYAYSFESETIRHTTPIPVKFNNVHEMVNNYIDSISQLPNFKNRPIDAVFIWSTSSPLQRFAHVKVQSNNTSDFLQMSKYGLFYQSYGNWIVKKFPLTYFANYIIPNFMQYFSLPVEALGTYNCGVDSVEDIAKIWFNYNTNHVTHTDLKWIITYLWIYSFLIPFTLTMQICIYIYSSTLTIWKESCTSIQKIQLLTFIFTTSNITFSTIASPIVLRYQIFNLLISTVITVLVLDSICSQLSLKKNRG